MTSNIIEKLNGLKNSKKLNPYINYIRFPRYRNLSDNLKIDFDFPLTAIVGQNGTNKSSVLRALYGCPKDYNVGNFWFSTDIDPINEDGGRSRFVYSYFQEEANRDVEVTKKRIHKKEKPDYWEPSRPSKADGMERMPDLKYGTAGREKTRWKLMEKDVIFIDFRSAISAFDKFFYHGDLKQTLRHNTKQDFIRSKSSLIKEAVRDDLKSKKMYVGKKEQIFKNILLPEEQVQCISGILGKKYTEIKLLEHKFFKSPGESVILSSMDLKYSEAFAGSGEFAVVILVNKIFEAPDKALIILDEPEVSLHPGAQERLVEFLLDRIKIAKHQIVIGTHSPFILKKLPEKAIKTLFVDPLSNKIKVTQETLPEEAFFHLGIKNDNKYTIFVEDRLGAEIIKKILRILGQAVYEQFQIMYPPGGASALLMNYLPAYARTDRTDVIFLLDGDQKPSDLSIDVDYSLLNDNELSAKLKKILGGDVMLPVDSGRDGPNTMQLREAKIKILSFCKDHLDYLPAPTPEEFVWNNMSFDVDKTISDQEISYKDKFVLLCKKELDKADYEKVKSDEIFHLQVRCLATVSNNLLNELASRIRNFLLP